MKNKINWNQYREKWLREIKNTDDFELSYIAGIAVAALVHRGYCAQEDLERLKIIIDGNFNKRQNRKKERKNRKNVSHLELSG